MAHPDGMVSVLGYHDPGGIGPRPCRSGPERPFLFGRGDDFHRKERVEVVYGLDVGGGGSGQFAAIPVPDRCLPTGIGVGCQTHP